MSTYESVSKSFRTGRLERELQMVQLSATRCNCIAILWVSRVSFASLTLCVASQRVFIVVSVYFVMDSVRKLLDTPSYVSWHRIVTFVNTPATCCRRNKRRQFYSNCPKGAELLKSARSSSLSETTYRCFRSGSGLWTKYRTNFDAFNSQNEPKTYSAYHPGQLRRFQLNLTCKRRKKPGHTRYKLNAPSHIKNNMISGCLRTSHSIPLMSQVAHLFLGLFNGYLLGNHII
jgi:hypothetical protein